MDKDGFPAGCKSMAQLYLSFLGPFTIQLGNKPVTQFQSDKVRALLSYLAVEAGKPHRRSALAGLLWPEHSERAARDSLRNALANLRQVIQDHKAEPPYLIIDSETVQLNLSSDFWLDVREFESLLRDQPSSTDFPQSKIANLKSAVSMYHGSFLQGFSLKDSPAFEEWALLVREDIDRKLVSALSSLAHEYEQRDEFAQACAYAMRLVAIEPWHEETYRQLMRLLALDGQRTAALAQYEACRRCLAEELGVQPGAETVQLYEQIRDGEIKGAPRLKVTHHNLPAMLSPIIGRERELNELSARLEDPACRLLTVVGPGGCGKTRLSIEAAYRQIERFKHGVYWVTLVGVQTHQAIPQAFAQALGFLFGPGDEPWQQILGYLRQKQILLVLDNFEHLLEAAGLVVELLLKAPEVKILVTSRARLNILEEDLFPLSGMEVPEESVYESRISEITSCDAVRLFLEGARRANPKYTPGDEDVVHIGAVCRLLAGIPLAVLLSASWARLLSPLEIATQIHQHNLDFLKTEWRDVPQRHRSMRLVFDYSWNLLTRGQQNALAGLSVFRGSFTFLAAQSVTKIELQGLRDLVDRSLVQLTSEDRFELHVLMREYTSEKLEELPDKSDEFNHRHCAFFAEMLARWAIALQGAGQAGAQQEITLEGENIPAAWEWALGHAQDDRLAQALDGLGGMYERRCLYRQGESLFHNSAAQIKLAISTLEGKQEMELSGRLLLLARILGWQSFFDRMLGNNQVAHQAIESGMVLLEGEHFQEQDTRLARAFLLQQRGLLFFNTDRDQSQSDLEESLMLYRLVGNTWREAQVLTSLAWVAHAYGHYQEAVTYLEESLKLQRSMVDYIGMADTLNAMSATLAEFGDFEKMAQFIQEQAIIIQKLGSPAQLADNLIIESVNLCYLGRFAESARLMEEAMAIQENLGNRMEVMGIGHSLGWMEVNQGLYDQGVENYQTYLAMARQLGNLHLVALGLLGLGEVFLARKDYLQARQTLLESAALYRQVPQEDELSLTLASLADSESRLGLSDQAKIHLDEALQIAAETGSWQACLHVIGKTAVFMALQGEVELGVEVYALATSYPYLGNSIYWEDCAGKQMAELAEGIPEAARIAAIERGKKRKWHETVRELCSWIHSTPLM
jgi:DNA-binding SARP family transcriptional activator/predicted ATPase